MVVSLVFNTEAITLYTGAYLLAQKGIKRLLSTF